MRDQWTHRRFIIRVDSVVLTGTDEKGKPNTGV